MAVNDNTPRTIKDALEHEQVNIVDRGEARSRDRRQSLDMSASAVSVKLIEQYIQPIMDEIEIQSEKTRANRGQNAKWLAPLSELPKIDVAYVAFMMCLDGHEKEWTYNTLANRVGQAIKCLDFEHRLQGNRAGMRLAQRLEQNATLQSDKVEKRQDYVLRQAAKRGFTFEKWEGDDGGLEQTVGSFLLSVVEAACKDVFMTHNDPKDETKEFPEKFMILRPEVEAEIEEKFADLDRVSPYLAPMNVMPRPWGLDQIGPYKTPRLAIMTPMVKHAGPEQRKDLDAGLRDGSLDKAVEALNLLQQVPYKVNDFVVDAVDWVRKTGKGRSVKKFPNTKTVEVPKLDEGVSFDDLDKDDQIAHMRNLTRCKAVNRQARANRSKIRRTLNEARELAQYDQFWMPHNWDRRGRVYHVSDFGHHNTDFLRAMFLFANKTKVTEENSAWIILQIANTYGLDKEGYDTRVKWVEENLERVINVGIDYKASFDFWSKADDPFQFLAACRDLAEYMVAKQEGKDHWSGLPVAVDATQSGIQHYAAASLNQDDGLLVNLVKGLEDKPNDLYKACLVVAEEMIEADKAEKLANQKLDPANDNDREAHKEYQRIMAEKADDLDEMDALEKRKRKAKRDYQRTASHRRLKRDQEIDIARVLLSYEVEPTDEDPEGKKYLNRNVIKRPAMVWAYSSRKYGFAQQFKKDWMDEMDLEVRAGEREKHPFPEDGGYQASHYLAAISQDAIESVIKSAKDGMEFFQACAKIMVDAGLHLTFKTPILNFPVHQYYRNNKSARRRVYLYSHKVINEETGEEEGIVSRGLMSFTRTMPGIDPNKSVSAVSPNIIHSMDSTLLMLTALRCADHGVTDLMVVHDSYATTCGNAEVMRDASRDAMVEMYDGYCLYSDLLEQCKARHPDPDSLEIKDQIHALQELIDHEKDEKLLKGLNAELDALKLRIVKWPEVPAKGDLDITKVRESDYFMT